MFSKSTLLNISIACVFLLNALNIECNESQMIGTPQKLTNCKAQLDSGKIIDLSPLSAPL